LKPRSFLTAAVIGIVVAALRCSNPYGSTVDAETIRAAHEWLAPHPTGTQLNAIGTNASGIVIAVGDRGIVLVSQDEAATWSQRDTSAGQAPRRRVENGSSGSGGWRSGCPACDELRADRGQALPPLAG